jgi:hypothetical protein
MRISWHRFYYTLYFLLLVTCNNREFFSLVFQLSTLVFGKISGMWFAKYEFSRCSRYRFLPDETVYSLRSFVLMNRWKIIIIFFWLVLAWYINFFSVINNR